jgi:L-cysteine:1D-myo-inositol 2-amino-2-deoxy-alpha-D-glucopyranoside ligase
MQALNVRPPDLFPRATDVVPGIVASVAALVETGVAYEAGGSVYFHVDSWPDFGSLSQIPRSEMLAVANERGNRPEDPNKRDPLDFVLWQAQAPGEPAWESPWGLGRPGWHIECSTMSDQLLGDTLDVHGGGADLMFPHHECEIAQAEAVGPKPFVRFWMHTAMVRHAGEKMSKSLGNLVMVRDLLQTWSPDALRLYLASHHYRAPWSHSEPELAQAEQDAQLLRDASTTAGGAGSAIDASEALDAFTAAMNADLDTPAALTTLRRLAEQIVEGAGGGQEVRPSQRALRRAATVFGLRLDRDAPEARVTDGWNAHLARFT